MKAVHHEGKVTGLAAYGNAETYAEDMRRLIAYHSREDNFRWPFLQNSWLDTFLLRTRLRWWVGIFEKYYPLPTVLPKEDFTTAADIAAVA